MVMVWPVRKKTDTTTVLGRSKRRGFSPGAAIRHLLSAVTHSDVCFRVSHVPLSRVFFARLRRAKNTPKKHSVFEMTLFRLKSPKPKIWDVFRVFLRLTRLITVAKSGIENHETRKSSKKDTFKIRRQDTKTWPVRMIRAGSANLFFSNIRSFQI